MLRYIARRLLVSIPVLLAVSVVVFFLMQNAGGGPLGQLRANPRVRPEDIERLKTQLGLDLPLWVQYLRWLRNFVTGNWGEGFFTHQPVMEIIAERLPRTLQLVGLALVFSSAIAIPLGVYSAIRQYSRFDHLVTGLSFLGYAMPIFFFGLLMQVAFAHYLTIWTGMKLFYTTGFTSVGGGGFVDRLQHLTLPVITLSIANVAGWSRYQRASMLEVIRAEFLRTARAMGLRERTVVFKHALRNALIPIVTVVTLDMPSLFGGAVVTETIFSMPGMGRLIFTAIDERDYPVVMAAIMVVSIAVVIFNLIADLLYAALDPRIRYE